MMKWIIWNWKMMKLINEKASGKRKEKVFRRGSWLVHHVKVIYTNTVLEKHASSENIYILILCYQWGSTINLLSNCWTNWSYLRINFTTNI